MFFWQIFLSDVLLVQKICKHSSVIVSTRFGGTEAAAATKVPNFKAIAERSKWKGMEEKSIWKLPKMDVLFCLVSFVSMFNGKILLIHSFKPLSLTCCRSVFGCSRFFNFQLIYWIHLQKTVIAKNICHNGFFPSSPKLVCIPELWNGFHCLTI